MECRIELIHVPVSDVDRSIAFYVDQCGFTLDHDHQVDASLRFVQVTPPTSACSIAFGTQMSDMPPGSQRGIQVVVADVRVARQALVEAGVEVSQVDEMPWGSFASFADPDGNAWTLQEVPDRT